MNFGTWLAFLGLEIVLALTPGPAVLFVVTQALRHGGGRAVFATLGILLANALYFALSGLGIAAVLADSPRVLTAVTWLGVGWLVYLALQALRSDGVVAAAAVDGGPTRLALLRSAFVLQIANPKALVFFAAILPGFVTTEANAWPAGLQILVLGVTSVVNEFCVLLGYGLGAGAASARMREPAFGRRLDRLAGVLLLTVAAWIALRS
jgi:threonine/homoserine/homoserine lactone efflux protein